MTISLKIPVLITGFNRPGHLQTLIQRLSQVRPTRIFVAIDGPRVGSHEDAAKVNACRESLTLVNWPCDVQTRLSETNLGCGKAVSSAIDWFLGAVECGIILEDDVLPDPTFFEFCATLLDRYANDKRVLAISGCSLVPPSGLGSPQLPYRFSNIPNIWGWALWRRTWENYDFDISDWRSMISTRAIWDCTGGSAIGTLLWGAWFDMVASGQIDTWDFQLVLTAMRTKQLTATSNRQLTQNLGFGFGATHQNHPPNFTPTIEPASFPLADVPVVADSHADAWARRHQLQTAQRVHQILQRSTPGFVDFAHEVRQLQRTTLT